jgi:hypothetical protein
MVSGAVEVDLNGIAASDGEIGRFAAPFRAVFLLPYRIACRV